MKIINKFMFTYLAVAVAAVIYGLIVLNNNCIDCSDAVHILNSVFGFIIMAILAFIGGIIVFVIATSVEQGIARRRFLKKYRKKKNG